MSVLLETSLGEIVIDLFVDKAPKACFNFIRLCQLKFYNDLLVHDVQKDYLAQMGDPTFCPQLNRPRTSVWGLAKQEHICFDDEIKGLKFNKRGLVATANTAPNQNNSVFFITLASTPIESLDSKHTIFGEVAEGFEVLDLINKAYVNK
jgi:peptidyl-prolyl cis-trans isomerase-like 4